MNIAPPAPIAFAVGTGLSGSPDIRGIVREQVEAIAQDTEAGKCTWAFGEVDRDRLTTTWRGLPVTLHHWPSGDGGRWFIEINGIRDPLAPGDAARLRGARLAAIEAASGGAHA